MLRPLQTHFLLFQQIFFVLVCIHLRTPRVPPRVLAQAKALRGQSPAGAKSVSPHYLSITRNIVHYSCPFDILFIGCVLNTKIVYTTAEKLTFEAFH